MHENQSVLLPFWELKQKTLWYLVLGTIGTLAQQEVGAMRVFVCARCVCVLILPLVHPDFSPPLSVCSLSERQLKCHMPSLIVP